MWCRLTPALATACYCLQAGYYCPDTVNVSICPSGYFCKVGCQVPIKCSSFSGGCKEGSSNPGPSFKAVIGIVFVLFVLWVLYFGLYWFIR